MARSSSDATRDRIVKAANSLFYGKGIRAVSVDAVAEKAGITKKTLYYHFRSKDDLVAAYLASRDQPNLDAFAGYFEAAQGSLPARIRAIFTGIATAAQHRRWKGCGFLRIAAELVDTPGHPAVKAAGTHKKRVEAWLAKIIAAEGLSGADPLARQIVLLMDGAFSTMLVHHDVAYIESAGDAAATLLANAAREAR
ncbi:TetR/AcrR family transcriptional regulator [Aquamicrobium sp. NLF2-7]|uniref:TetR/AcrR family transcriptional regulator n=1 Tax=Aquamicrobium sp. NLF2-7 TaxID=2918753 RepID=UPI001EFBD27F|nr:TetR/AcrR family transcriptional regulator [Aquamicrobium sp. NLF2-7]MCG8272221.1 TetR/AcrR family transcriptional regulator [Aquamicrobium sp. NLF2-7]